MYSLVNAPTVGFDLARLATGASVATVLLEALALQGAPLPVRAEFAAADTAHLADPRRAVSWLAVSAITPQTRLGDTLSAAKRVIDEAVLDGRAVPGGPADVEPVLSELGSASFGGLDDLLQLVRTDILAGEPEHVVALASDAMAAAYGGRKLPDDVRSALGAPWISRVRMLPSIPADLGPYANELRTVLDRIVTLTESEIAVMVRAAAATETDWARRMHAAAWAAYLSGRLRPAASAQFQAVRALRASGLDGALRASGLDGALRASGLDPEPRAGGFDSAGAAAGAWNAISGCLQAIATHDLLDEVTYGVLVAPWESALGILG